MPIWKDASYFDSLSKDVDDGEPKYVVDDQKQGEDGLYNENDAKDKSDDDSSPKEVNTVGQHVNNASPDVNTGSLKLNDVVMKMNQKLIFRVTSQIRQFQLTPNTRIHKDHPIENVIGDVKLNQQALLKLYLIHLGWKQCRKNFCNSNFNRFGYLRLPIGKRAIGTKWVFRNKKDERGIVIRNKARIEAIRLFFAYASFMGFLVYQMDVKSAFLYGTIEEEVYVTQPSGFKDPDHPDKVYNVVEALYGLHQAPRACSMGELTFFLGLQVQQKEEGIFISQDKYVVEILKKFNYTDVKSASTPVDLEKPLVKDEDVDDVDVHLYRSMIGSLMYLIASRPDIMFAVCACARFQVTPKTSHLLAVKRIFRYLKGKPTLGLWYSRDSPFELVAYTDSDYAGATQDKKSTTRGCQFLGNRLISWQCKKQTVVPTSTIEAKYVTATSCCGQILWIQNQLLDYRYNFMNTVINIDNNNLLTKGFDAGRFQYLVSSIGMLNP
ncbi:putative ribonuclease H-like domain-containing protein [Tanacetum coccineum]